LKIRTIFVVLKNKSTMKKSVIILAVVAVIAGSCKWVNKNSSSATETEELLISVTLASDEFLSKYNSFVEFVEFDEEGYQKIVITTNVAVKDFKFIEIGINFDPFYIYERSVVYSMDELLPESPFVVTWLEQGTFPHRGISYLDDNHTRKYFSLSMNQAEPEESDRGMFLLNEFQQVSH